MDKTARPSSLSQSADRRPFLLPLPERRVWLVILREFHILEPERLPIQASPILRCGLHSEHGDAEQSDAH
jgi:hypothetical protein